MTDWSERLRRHEAEKSQHERNAQIKKLQEQEEVAKGREVSYVRAVAETDEIFKKFDIPAILREIKRDVWEEGVIERTPSGNGLELYTEIPDVDFEFENYWDFVTETYQTGPSGGGSPATTRAKKQLRRISRVILGSKVMKASLTITQKQVDFCADFI